MSFTRLSFRFMFFPFYLIKWPVIEMYMQMHHYFQSGTIKPTYYSSVTYSRALLCKPPFFSKVFCEFKGFDSCSFQYLIINLEHFSSHQINILPVHSYLRQSCRWNLFLTIYCDDFWQSTSNIIRVIMAEISSN